MTSTTPLVGVIMGSRSDYQVLEPAIEILRDFGAKEAAGYRVRRVSLNLGGAAVLHGDENAAGVGAIVRTGSVDNALHRAIISARCFGSSGRNWSGNR